MTTISELQREAWQTAEEKGFHVEGRTVGDVCALIHSEVSEIMEAYRKSPAKRLKGDMGEELADVLIRCGDAAECWGIDLEECVRWKLEKNKGRPFKHGGVRI